MSPRLSIAGVAKAFAGRQVLRGIDLDVAQGEVVAIVGPSGGGKTTLLRIIAGFEDPDEGTVMVDGDPMVGPRHNVPAERRRIGIVPQEGALFPHLDVGGNIGFGLGRGPDRARRVADMLALVGLPGSEGRRPADLSGGQQQRVALARALAPSPRLLLLDEPFAALDANLRAQVRDETLALVRAAGATAVLVTHDRTEAFSVADRVGILLGGRLAQVGTPDSVYSRPANCDVALFTGDGVVLRGEYDGVAIRHPLGALRLESGPHGPMDLVVRPEHVALTMPSDPAATATGTVTGVTFHGHDTMVRVVLSTGEQLLARTPGHHAPRYGEAVGLRLAEPPLLFPATT